MISTRDIETYYRCKREKESQHYKYKPVILEHLRKRCPKLQPNEKWVESFCAELETRTDNYLKVLTKFSKKDLQSILEKLGYKYAKSSWDKKKLSEQILEILMYCKNHETLFGDSITEIDPKKLYKTVNDYCHNIDELLNYLISSKDSHIDPLDSNNVEKLWNNQIYDKQQFLDNSFHDKQSLKNYHQMISQKKRKQQAQMNMELYKFIEMIGKLGFVFANDETTSHAQTGFETSAKLIASFTQILENNPAVKDKVMNLKNYNSQTVAEILASTNSTCIHGVGFSLVKIYLYHYLKFKNKFPNLKLLPLFLKENKYYKCPQFLQGNTLIKAIEKATPGQNVDYLYYFPESNDKFESYKRVPGTLQVQQIEAMQELISEFDLV